MPETLELSTCGCPEISPKVQKKHYQEIGAEVIGNQLIIRVESPKKSKKNQWIPPCDCEIPEIRRPSKKEGPRVINAESNNQIIFQINSKSRVTSDDPNFRADTISQLEANQDVPYGRLLVHPHLDSSGQEVESEHITVGNRNVYMMRIKKKADAKEQKKRNIELEVHYPKFPPRPSTPPSPPPPPPPAEEPKEAPKEPAKPKNAKKKK